MRLQEDETSRWHLDRRTSHHLVNHWTPQPEWTAERRLLAVYVTFAQQHLIDALTSMQTPLIGVPGLDLVDPAWLHMTLTGIEFVDHLNCELIEQLRSEFTSALTDIGRLELTLGEAVPERDAVCVLVHPVEPIEAIRTRLLAVLRDVLPGGTPYRLPQPEGGFRPHISIGYALQYVPGPVLRRHLDVVPAPAVNFTIEDVTLLELSRANRVWSWSNPRPLSLVG